MRNYSENNYINFTTYSIYLPLVIFIQTLKNIIMKKHNLLFILLIALISCSQEEQENEQKGNNLTLRAVVASPIDQLVGIPVTITLPSGVAESRRAYLSTKKKNYTVNFNYEDDGSGREKWVIGKYGSGYSLRALSCHNNNPYLYR